MEIDLDFDSLRDSDIDNTRSSIESAVSDTPAKTPVKKVVASATPAKVAVKRPLVRASLPNQIKIKIGDKVIKLFLYFCIKHCRPLACILASMGSILLSIKYIILIIIFNVSIEGQETKATNRNETNFDTKDKIFS